VITFEDLDFRPTGRDALYYVRAIQEKTPMVNGGTLRCEYDAQGKVCWEVAVGSPTSATRLPNGHTLVVSGGAFSPGPGPRTPDRSHTLGPITLTDPAVSLDGFQQTQKFERGRFALGWTHVAKVDSILTWGYFTVVE